MRVQLRRVTRSASALTWASAPIRNASSCTSATSASRRDTQRLTVGAARDRRRHPRRGRTRRAADIRDQGCMAILRVLYLFSGKPRKGSVSSWLRSLAKRGDVKLEMECLDIQVRPFVDLTN